MKNIHIVCKAAKNNPPKPVVKGGNVFTSGTWKISDKTADELLGGKVFFHQGQDKPSHFGGKINSFTDAEDGRKIIVFERDMSCCGITSRGGWSYEMKIVDVQEQYNL